MKRLIFLLSILLTTFAALRANDSTKIRSIFDDFYQPARILEMTLQFDCKKLIRHKNKEEKFLATLTFQSTNGDTMTQSIHIKCRGKMRLSVCTFPPLKLDFDKDSLRQMGLFATADNLKLVTHCASSKLNDAQVLKELLVYKLYNIITEKSFRVQLLRMKYVDLDGNLYADELAFLMEPTEAVAYRIECRESAKNVLALTEFDAVSYNQMVLFEYMIGNVDWSIPARHNVELLKSLQNGFRVVVPYDFDYSGVVSASYAVNDERVNQKYLGERVVLSGFTDEAAFQDAVAHFLAKEATIFDTCANFTHLEEKERTQVIKYLKPFYDLMKESKLNAGKLKTSSNR